MTPPTRPYSLPVAATQELDGLDITEHGESMVARIEGGWLDSSRHPATAPLPQGPHGPGLHAAESTVGAGAKVTPDSPHIIEVVSNSDDKRREGEAATVVTPFSD